MAYITETELRSYSGTLTFERRATAERVLRKEGVIQKTVFLSHSHSDAKLIDEARKFLATHGIGLYVDWKDPTMPKIAGPATAQKLKERIRQCNKFVMLASQPALASKWVPWELGFADSAKSLRCVAILPVAANDGTWQGSEYVAIYRKIEKTASGQWRVCPAGGGASQDLRAWLMD